MPKLSILPTLTREFFCKRTLPREPEPDLVMDDAEQVEAYSLAGRIDGVMSAAYLYHSGKISQVIRNCKKVVDLGCGPATQLAQIAELNPNIDFLGIDLSSEMLESAEKHISDLGLCNVSFRQGDITDLSFIPDDDADGVISTMALHHLPTLDLLRGCFKEIKRINKENGALYLVDFGRLKSLKSVIYFAYINREYQPHLFSLDYERSLRAAFELEEFQSLASQIFSNKVKVYATFLMPILTAVKTEDYLLDDQTKKQLVGLSNGLASKYKSDLNDIRSFFKMGGMKNDPFQ